MTVERKIVVGFDDLKALIFECRECKSRVTVSPDGARIPRNCPSCGIEWLLHPPPDTTVTGSMHVNLIQAIGKVRAIEDKRVWPKFDLLLEFDEPELAGRKG